MAKSNKNSKPKKASNPNSAKSIIDDALNQILEGLHFRLPIKC